jgi:hypothetical protein
MHSCYLVPPLLHAIFSGRFSPPGTSILDWMGHPFIPKQDVAASCVFLATKTEECGRKLRDVARVYQAKVKNVDVNAVPADSKVFDSICFSLLKLTTIQEVDVCQSAILLTEEVLLEALCFDFVVESPHAELLDLFESLGSDTELQEYAWSLAHDS